MRTAAATVGDYLAELPPERRALVADLRALVRANLPEGYVEAMRWGMIAYEVPLEVSGKTYNGQPLMYAAIGAQKRHVALYLCGLYCRPELMDRFRAAHARAGLTPDMGKSCLRVTRPEGIHRAAVAEAVAALEVAEFVAASRR